MNELALFAGAGGGILGAGCSAGAQSVPSKSTSTPGACLWPGRTMGILSRSPSGTTCEPSTGVHGLAAWMSSLAVSRVRISRLQGRAQASTASGQDCGPSSRASFARWDHNSSSWKTLQLLLLEDLRGCSVTWPRSGMMRNGACLERPPLAPRIDARGCGFWPTPTVCGNYNRKGLSKTSGDGLATAVRQWPTPTACMSKGSSPAALTRKDGRSRESDRLDHAVMSAHGGQLNPTWVEWLMGWPLEWTACDASETAKSRSAQQKRRGNSRGGEDG